MDFKGNFPFLTLTSIYGYLIIFTPFREETFTVARLNFHGFP